MIEDIDFMDARTNKNDFQLLAAAKLNDVSSALQTASKDHRNQSHHHLACPRESLASLEGRLASPATPSIVVVVWVSMYSEKS